MGIMEKHVGKHSDLFACGDDSNQGLRYISDDWIVSTTWLTVCREKRGLFWPLPPKKGLQR
jgi:hypothetical protein